MPKGNFMSVPIPYPIIHEAYHAITSSLQQLINKHNINITREQLMILRSLKYQAGDNQSAIALSVSRDRRNISKTIKILEEKKLIIRQENPDNKKAYSLFLSEEGENILAILSADIEQWRENIVGNLSQKEVEELFATLNTIISNVK